MPAGLGVAARARGGRRPRRAGIYRGGVRLDLGRFFRVTGIVLVLVAAGLLASAMHSAHEAGWVDGGQAEASTCWLVVEPGTVCGSLLTGMLGLQPEPTVIEVAAWLVYAVPMLIFVAAPDRVQRERARLPRWASRPSAIPAVLVVGLAAGGDAGEPAAQAGAGAAGARTVPGRASPTPGASRRGSRCAAGPATFEVSSARLGQGDGVRGGPRRRARWARPRTSSPGCRRAVLAHAASRAATAALPGRDAQRGRRARGQRAARGSARSRPSSPAAWTATAATWRPTRTSSSPRTAALHRRPAGRRRRPGRALFAATRAPYETDRARRRELRRPRPARSTRASTTSSRATPWTGFHVIERRCGWSSTTRGTGALADGLQADVERLQALVRTVELEPAQIANGATELLGRGREVEGHGRGGPLLAHRPVGLPGQRRGRQGGLRRRSRPRCAGGTPTLARRSRAASPPSTPRCGRTAAATGSCSYTALERAAGPPARAARSTRSPSRCRASPARALQRLSRWPAVAALRCWAPPGRPGSPPRPGGRGLALGAATAAPAARRHARRPVPRRATRRGSPRPPRTGCTSPRST